MVGSAVAGILLLGIARLSIPEFFLTLSVLNLAVVLYVYKQVPEFALRFVILMLSHTLYRVKHMGLEYTILLEDVRVLTALAHPITYYLVSISRSHAEPGNEE